MKAFLASSFIAALIAFLFTPLNFETAGSALFAAGFAAIAISDYARRLRPLRISAAEGVTLPRKERFGLAA